MFIIFVVLYCSNNKRKNMQKMCIDCEKVYANPEIYFAKNKNRKDGFQVYCKVCTYERQKKSRDLPKDKKVTKPAKGGFKICSYCLEEKALNKFNKSISQKDGYHSYCQECQKEYWEKYKLNNSNSINRKRREYYYKNRAIEIKKAIEYQRANKEKVRIYKLTYASKTKEVTALRVQRWRENNPIHAKMLRQLTRSGNVNITKENFLELFRRYQVNSDEYRCHYCECRMPLKKTTIDHVVPLSKGGLNDIANLVISCLSCNRKKGDKIIK